MAYMGTQTAAQKTRLAQLAEQDASWRAANGVNSDPYAPRLKGTIPDGRHTDSLAGTLLKAAVLSGIGSGLTSALSTAGTTAATAAKGVNMAKSATSAISGAAKYGSGAQAAMPTSAGGALSAIKTGIGTLNKIGLTSDILNAGASIAGGLGKSKDRGAYSEERSGFRTLPKDQMDFASGDLWQMLKQYALSQYQGMPTRKLDASDTDPIFGSKRRVAYDAMMQKQAAAPSKTPPRVSDILSGINSAKSQADAWKWATILSPSRATSIGQSGQDQITNGYLSALARNNWTQPR